MLIVGYYSWCIWYVHCSGSSDYDSSGLHTSGCTCGISVGKCPVYCVVGFLFWLLFWLGGQVYYKIWRLFLFRFFWVGSFHKHGNLISEQSPGSPNPLFYLAIHPSQPHTNEVSCSTYFPMDTQAANRIWLPTKPRVCNLINLYIRSHLYTTDETTNYNNPPNMKTDEHINPQILYIYGNNTAHCYSTTPQVKKYH